MWFSFLSTRFKSRYTEKDYPVQVKLRQDLYFEASVKSKDKTLSVLSENCVATPTQDSKHATSYPLITNGLVMLLLHWRENLEFLTATGFSEMEETLGFIRRIGNNVKEKIAAFFYSTGCFGLFTYSDTQVLVFFNLSADAYF